MRLSEFIDKNRLAIIGEWESFAKTLNPASNMSRLQLRDHVDEILSFIIKDITSSQTPSEQQQKSHGKSDSKDYKDSAAEIHGDVRQNEGFDIIQMVSEYRALRSSIIKLWTNIQRVLSDSDVLDLTRFNEAIDQALAESVVRFVKKVDYSRDLLLGVLGHDIRSPLGAIKMSAQLIPMLGNLNEKQTTCVAQIESCNVRISNIVSDLLDLTKARQGGGLPVTRNPMDIGILSSQIVDEMNTQYPDNKILLKITGEMKGKWDEIRLGQAFSNLISNALQYGSKNDPINVTITGQMEEVIISIHNMGNPIPPTKLKTIFNSFTRGDEDGNSNPEISNLGLGLFITSEIVLSHNGTIQVTSNKEAGTTFTIKLPRL